MASVLVPVLYLVVLVGSLLVFSNYYRKRVACELDATLAAGVRG